MAVQTHRISIRSALSGRYLRPTVTRCSQSTIAAVPAAVPALRQNGGIIVTPTIDDAVDLAQRLAPEHLVCDTEKIAERVTRAGTVFVGRFSAQACGDYVTGSNHVLPTSGAAAARGGLSAADFVRLSTVQRLTADGLKRIGPAAVALADAEGLSGHALSVRIRLSSSRIADRAGVAGERRA